MVCMPWVKLCSPNDEEVVGDILLPKILGNAELLDNFISEVDICRFDPQDLRLESRDLFWYFYSKRENKYLNGTQQKRTTPSGFWKLTGDPFLIKDHRQFYCKTQGDTIGYRRLLVFQTERKSSNKSDWLMHEFHCTLLPEHLRTYVVCRLEYKGKDMNILSYNPPVTTPTFVIDMSHSAGSVVDQRFSDSYNSVNEGQQFGGSLVMDQSVEGSSVNQAQLFSGDFNTQQLQAPYSALCEEEPEMLWDYVIERNYENRSNHRPRKPVTGVLADYGSDSDTASKICGDTSSSITDTVAGGSKGPYHELIDEVTSLTTIEPSHNGEAQEQPKQLKLQVPGKEKMIYAQKMAEDSVKKAPSTKAVKQMFSVLEEMSLNCVQNLLVEFVMLTERPLRDYFRKK